MNLKEIQIFMQSQVSRAGPICFGHFRHSYFRNDQNILFFQILISFLFLFFFNSKMSFSYNKKSFKMFLIS